MDPIKSPFALMRSIFFAFWRNSISGIPLKILRHWPHVNRPTIRSRSVLFVAPQRNWRILYSTQRAFCGSSLYIALLFSI